MTVKSKFKAGDIIYYKYPSRYTRSSEDKTIEAIIKIHGVLVPTYNAEVIKRIRGDIVGSIAFRQGGSGIFQLDTLELDTYSRHLTPAEKVLYG